MLAPPNRCISGASASTCVTHCFNSLEFSSIAILAGQMFASPPKTSLQRRKLTPMGTATSPLQTDESDERPPGFFAQRRMQRGQEFDGVTISRALLRIQYAEIAKHAANQATRQHGAVCWLGNAVEQVSGLSTSNGTRCGLLG